MPTPLPDRLGRVCVEGEDDVEGLSTCSCATSTVSNDVFVSPTRWLPCGPFDGVLGMSYPMNVEAGNSRARHVDGVPAAAADVCNAMPRRSRRVSPWQSGSHASTSTLSKAWRFSWSMTSANSGNPSTARRHLRGRPGSHHRVSWQATRPMMLCGGEVELLFPGQAYRVLGGSVYVLWPGHTSKMPPVANAPSHSRT